MLFTWDTTNLCIVFRQWHIRSAASLALSLVAVVLLAMGYEALRALSRRYEDSISRRVAALPSEFASSSPPPPPELYAPGLAWRQHISLIAPVSPKPPWDFACQC